MKLFTLLIVAVAGAFGTASPIYAESIPATHADILIGMAGPLTGPNGWLGEQTERGLALAVAELNAAGGVLGRQVEVVTADDYCDGEQAIAAAKKLIAAGVAAVFGHPCSGAAIPASRAYADAGIVLISDGATNPQLTDESRPNVFRVCGRDDRQGAMAGEYLAGRWGNKRISILHDGQAYGQGIAWETKRRLNELGGEEVLFEAVEPGEVDYFAAISMLQANSIDVVYFGGYAPEAGLILRQARSQGFGLRLVTGDGVVTEDFSLIAGPAAEGALSTSFAEPLDRPEAAEVVAAFRARSYEPIGTLYTYAAIQAWAQAVEKAGTLELDALIAALRSEQFHTVLGRICFDARGDVTGYEPFAWYVWTGDHYEPVDPAALVD